MQNVEAPALAVRSPESSKPFGCRPGTVKVTMPVLTRGLNDKNEEACSSGQKFDGTLLPSMAGEAHVLPDCGQHVQAS